MEYNNATSYRLRMYFFRPLWHITGFVVFMSEPHTIKIGSVNEHRLGSGFMKKLFVCMVVICAMSLSGCQWARNLGDRLPVYGGNKNRCQDWFCFSSNSSRGASRESVKREKYSASSGSERRKLYGEGQGATGISTPPSPAEIGVVPHGVQHRGGTPSAPLPGQAAGPYGSATGSPAAGAGQLPPGIVAPPGAPIAPPSSAVGGAHSAYGVGQQGTAIAPVPASQAPAPVTHNTPYPSHGTAAPSAEANRPYYYDEWDELEGEDEFNPDLYRPQAVEARKEAKKQLLYKKYKDAGLKDHEIYQKWQDDLPEGPLGEIRKTVGW